MKLKYIKTRDVKDPIRGTSWASGVDFFVPDDYHKESIYFGESIKIPSGINVILPKGYDIQFVNKSGIALNKGLSIKACLIDGDYRGEMSLHLNRCEIGSTVIRPGEKIAQGVIRKVELCEIEEISDEEFQKHCNTERGEGGFGSTGE